MRFGLSDHINFSAGMRNGTGTIGGELDLIYQPRAALKWPGNFVINKTGSANLETQVLTL